MISSAQEMPQSKDHRPQPDRHNTPEYQDLKVKSSPTCSEPNHVQGTKVQGCLVCSVRVCEACIIKASFGQRDDRAFANRTRSLCPDCYNLGNARKDVSMDGLKNDDCALLFDPGELFCVCTAKDGHLCFRCKTMQKFDSRANRDKCHGDGCSRTKAGGFASRVCLWCGLRLSSDHDRVVSRREYNSRHLLARSHSTYERRTVDEVMEIAEFDSLSTYQASLPKRVGPGIQDPFEIDRLKELKEVSARRSLTAAAAEDARWARAESLRRLDTKIYCAPPKKRYHTLCFTAQSSNWCDRDSVAPTLVDRDLEEASDPSAYTYCNVKPETTQPKDTALRKR